MRKTSQKFSQSHMLCKVALVAIMLVFQAMLGIGAVTDLDCNFTIEA